MPVMPTSRPTGRSAVTAPSLLARLRRDQSGNILAMTAAAVIPMIGMVGGAVDMSRAYMTKARLQQACDAGALATRRAMASDNALTEPQKLVGYKFFDFNFKNGDYGATLTSRTYTQPTSTQGTPQAIINGSAAATVPTTLMRVFGNETMEVSVTCSSRMDIVNADVAMVLDVTGSMATAMRIRAGANATEPRLAALQKSVKAFYDTLGPGRAGGDASKGRVRYAFIPYGTTVNVGYLLANSQMVDAWDYPSVSYSKTVWGYTTGGESVPSYSSWSPTTPPASVIAALNTTASYTSNTNLPGNGNYNYTRVLDGTAASLPLEVIAANTATCDAYNTFGSGSTKLRDAENLGPGSASETIAAWSPAAPVYTSPASFTPSQTRNYTNTRTVTSRGLIYQWQSNKCRLNARPGRSQVNWNQTQTRTGTRPVSWTPYEQFQTTPQYLQRRIDVSPLKAGGTNWNNALTVSNIFNNGPQSTVTGIVLSGTTTATDITINGTNPKSFIWRGCVEERTTDPTITSSTSIDTIPVNAIDLNVTTLANPMADATRWRPWLPDIAYKSGGSVVPGTALADPEDCPAPAIRLQEIGDYENTPLISPYPNLFQTSAGDPPSIYYPFNSGLAISRKPSARNYIDRFSMTDGTLHDVGFLWGLHLVSGDGMFSADNPDEFNSFTVNRNIVFMTDGEMNPAEERYAYTGWNQRDGRVAPTGTNNTDMTAIHNRRLRLLCAAAKRQGITVWVVAITATATSTENYSDLRACASSTANFKSAATSTELIASFTTIAQNIGGLRISG